MYAFLKHVFTENESLFHSYEENFCKNQGVKLKLFLNSLQNGTSSLWKPYSLRYVNSVTFCNQINVYEL